MTNVGDASVVMTGVREVYVARAAVVRAIGSPIAGTSVAQSARVQFETQSVAIMQACLSRALLPMSNHTHSSSGSSLGSSFGATSGPSFGPSSGSSSSWRAASNRRKPLVGFGGGPVGTTADAVESLSLVAANGHPQPELRGIRRIAPAVIAEHVLMTSDGSPLASQAVPLAISAIRACASRRVTLLRVLTQPGHQLGVSPVQALEWEISRAHAEAGLRQLAGEFGDVSDCVDQVVEEGRAAEQILRFVDTRGVDLVVMAAHGSDDSRGWRMGSVARKVVASGRSSVLIVPTDEAGDHDAASLRRVLVPLDCSARAECVLPLVMKLVETHDSQITLLHVVPRPETPHRLPAGARDRELIEELTRRNTQRGETYMQGVRERLVSRGARVEVEIRVDDHPARAIEQFAVSSRADLILIAAHGSSAHEREAYGSLAHRLLETMVKPLWIVQDLPQATGQAGGQATGQTTRLSDAGHRE